MNKCISLFIFLFSLLPLASQEDFEYTPPAEHVVKAADLPDKIKAAFTEFLPEQKAENCNWYYTETEQPIDWNKKKKKYMKVRKVKLYATRYEPGCVLKSGDFKSPQISFIMNDSDLEPNVSASVDENSEYIPKDILAKARELTGATNVQSINITLAPKGAIFKIDFSFLDGLRMCNVTLNSAGKELNKASCTQGAYGGMD